MGHEALIKCTSATTLKWDINQVRQIDHVMAVAIATKNNEVGGLMLRIEALDVHSLRGLMLILAKDLKRRHKLTLGFSWAISNSVIKELLHPGCTKCGGKGEIHRESEAVIICPHCNGTGLHRYADKERTDMIGGRYNRDAYEYALNYVRNSLGAAVRCSNGMIE